MMKIIMPKTIALAAVLMTLASGVARAEMIEPSVAYPDGIESHVNHAGVGCDGCGQARVHFSSDDNLFNGSSLDGVR